MLHDDKTCKFQMNNVMH